MMIDTGLPVGQFTDVVQSHGDLVDLVKLGWGTAVVTRRLPEKLDRLREALQARPYGAPGPPADRQHARLGRRPRPARPAGPAAGRPR